MQFRAILPLVLLLQAAGVGVEESDRQIDQLLEGRAHRGHRHHHVDLVGPDGMRPTLAPAPQSSVDATADAIREHIEQLKKQQAALPMGVALGRQTPDDEVDEDEEDPEDEGDDEEDDAKKAPAKKEKKAPAKKEKKEKEEPEEEPEEEDEEEAPAKKSKPAKKEKKAPAKEKKDVKEKEEPEEEPEEEDEEEAPAKKSKPAKKEKKAPAKEKKDVKEKEEPEEEPEEEDEEEEEEVEAPPAPKKDKKKKQKSPAADSDDALPFGDLEPFGREKAAQDLTEASIRQSDAMVDQIEKAELAEEQRSVFRALTRLRGAALASFDGIAKSATGNIKEYAATSQWRQNHPVQHLAQEEADVEQWAFPSNAD